MFIGVPVALAFLAANMVGATIFMGGNGDLMTQMSRGIGQLANNAVQTVTTFNLMPVPMFLLMGEIFFFTGLANRMFGAIDKLMGRIPGCLRCKNAAIKNTWQSGRFSVPADSPC